MQKFALYIVHSLDITSVHEFSKADASSLTSQNELNTRLIKSIKEWQ